MVEFKGSTDSVVCTHITLSEEGFNNLVTFNAPARFGKDGKLFLKSLCAVRLCEAVETVLKKISDCDGHGGSIWEKLGMALKDTSDSCDEWITSILSLSKSYDYDCMGKLWIRNLSYPDCTFSGEFAYKDCPIMAIHATTWSNISGVLEWQAAKSCLLKNNGVFDKNQQRRFYLEGHEESKSIRVVPKCD